MGRCKGIMGRCKGIMGRCKGIMGRCKTIITSFLSLTYNNYENLTEGCTQDSVFEPLVDISINNSSIRLSISVDLESLDSPVN